jgi:uncharacterized membrane protein YsdA (DUF1294 family)
VSRTTVRHVLFGLAAAVAIAAALHLGLRVPPLWAWFVAISGVTFAMVAYDKYQARVRGWRVPEGALHALAFSGGCPGALLAQRIFRHKTSKRSFQIAFWAIFLTQLALLAWWIARQS